MNQPHDPYGGQGYPPQQQQGWGGQQQPGGYQMPAHGHAQGQSMPYDADPNPIASEASPEVRAKFIERTYLHLAGAIAVFAVLVAALQVTPGVDTLVSTMLASTTSWWIVLLAFIGVSYLADRWARGSRSPGMQYAGLGLYTVAEAVIFTPLIYIGLRFELIDLEGIAMAGGVTLAMFAAMTAYVFITKKDFSFLRGILGVLTMGALGLVFCSLLFDFTLGLAFCVGMVALACGYILYYTSNVLRHYRVNQHVAAALALFSAVALLFWYVLRLFMRR